MITTEATTSSCPTPAPPATPAAARAMTDRRSFLKLLATGAVTATAACTPLDGLTPNSGVILGPGIGGTAGPVRERVLVVVELHGGNDGLSTLIPYGDGTYYDYRPTLAVREADVLPFDGQLGLHPSLAGLHARGVAAIAGVGTTVGTLSHFQMLDRWWTGDPSGREAYKTGFLGRCCDELGDGNPVTGVSLAVRPSPMIVAARTRTATLGDMAEASALFNGANSVFRSKLPALGRTANDFAPALTNVARTGIADAVAIADFITRLAPPSVGYPETEVGQSMAAASRLIRTNAGIRVIHVETGHDFDTHDDQNPSQPQALAEIDAALSTFLDDMKLNNRADDVLVATVSEFGRRAKQNKTGTDHGNGSVALLAGPVRAGVHGVQPSLRKLDTNDNLAPSVGLSDYYATLAESWLGVSASEVLSRGATPVTNIIRT